MAPAQEQRELVFEGIHLPNAKRLWLPFADLPPHVSSSVQDLVHSLSQLAPEGFVLRGCPPALIRALKQKQSGQSLCSGREALLDLQGDHFERKKIRALIRRGNRHGRVIEISPFSSSAQTQTRRLCERVFARYPIQLRHLYRHSGKAPLRLMGFESEAGQLLGLVSLSRSGQQTWHTEQMLRRPDAPVGMMAALLEAVFLRLQAEGYAYWSLGEVPFYPLLPPQNLKESLLQQAGRSLDPVYSAEGLFKFKAKFRPWWRPVYLYGSPDLSWAVLWDLFRASRCSDLAWRALALRGAALLGK